VIQYTEDTAAKETRIQAVARIADRNASQQTAGVLHWRCSHAWVFMFFSVVFGSRYHICQYQPNNWL